MDPLPSCVTHLEEDYRVYVTLVRGTDRVFSGIPARESWICAPGQKPGASWIPWS